MVARDCCRGVATGWQRPLSFDSPDFGLGKVADMIVVLTLSLLVAIAALILWRREAARRAGAEERAERADRERRDAEHAREEHQRARLRLQRALLAEREW